LTYVAGQLISKLVIEPVQETRKTIGQVSHALIERANVIQNPGVPTTEVMRDTSRELRKLSSQLQSWFQPTDSRRSCFGYQRVQNFSRPRAS
ncbi:MAG: hypothetical protein ACREI9_15780, partial [Nitrospiraceae bacterium]